MTVIPMKTLFLTIALWTTLDIFDASVLHWFDMTPQHIFDKAFFETSLTLCCWLTNSRRIPA